jgi:VanZ family protein
MMRLGSLEIGRKAGRLWLLALLWTGIVLWLGGDAASSSATSRFLRPLLRWLLPDASPYELYRIHMGLRKGAHVAEYGLLALLAWSALRASARAAMLRLAGLALVWVLAIAACDEGRQSFSAARTGSPWDVALDVFGGVLALALAIAYTRLMHSRRAPLEGG